MLDRTDKLAIIFILILAVAVGTVSWTLANMIERACPKGLAHCVGQATAEMEKGFKEGRGAND